MLEAAGDILNMANIAFSFCFRTEEGVFVCMWGCVFGIKIDENREGARAYILAEHIFNVEIMISIVRMPREMRRIYINMEPCDRL